MFLNHIIDKLEEEFSTRIRSDHGCYAVKVNDSTVVYLDPSGDHSSFVIYTAIGEVPSNPENTFRRLLIKNLYGVGTLNATIGLDEQTNKIILHRRLENAHTTYETFQVALKQLVHSAQECKQALEA